MNDNVIWLIVLVAIFYFLSQPQAPIELGDKVDLSSTIDSSVSFTAQDRFVAGTALIAEYVRIINLDGNGKRWDLGAVSLDSGTKSTTPNDNYIFYYFMNNSDPSSNYYTSKVEYTAPEQDAVDYQVGYGCEIDTIPIFASKDSNGNRQTATAFAQSVTASVDQDISVMVKVHNDKCYGAPDSTEANVLCFVYNSTAFTKVELGTKVVPSHRGITGNATTGYAVRCHEFPVLQDFEWIEMSVHLDAGATEPTTSHNISVYSDDIAFDLHKNTLAEIQAYEDEDGHDLAAPFAYLGEIYIS